MDDRLIKFQFISANPLHRGNNPRVRPEKEFDELADVFKLYDRRERFRVELPLLTARSEELHRTLRRMPHIIHFGGHGIKQRGLVLENSRGEAIVVDMAALTELLSKLKGHVRLVFLNACDTLEQAEMLRDISDYVIGHNRPVLDEDAIVFSKVFYEILADGKSVQEAFDWARSQLGVHSRYQNEVKLVIKDGVDASASFIEQVAGKFGRDETPTLGGAGNQESVGGSGPPPPPGLYGENIERHIDRDHLQFGVKKKR